MICYNYDIFFESLKNNQNIISGEIQVSNGYQGLMNINNGPGLFAHRIESWCDFGSSENYSKLIKKVMKMIFQARYGLYERNEVNSSPINGSLTP